MKILFLGDSITQGCGASSIEKCFVNLVEKDLKCIVRNYGVSGTRFARQKFVYSDTYSNYDFNLRADIMEDDADLVFVFGGTNDFGHGYSKFGKKNDNDVYTFCGGTNTLFKKLIKHYGKSKIRVILPLNRFDDEFDLKNIYGDSLDKPSFVKLKDYVLLIKERANHYGLKVLDYSKEFPKPKSNKNEGLFIDGLHPNDKGHRLLADLIIKEIKASNLN